MTYPRAYEPHLPLPPTPAPEPRNGSATAGFVCGLVGLSLAWIPLIGIVAWPLVLVGLVLSIIGIARVRRGRSSGAGFALAGVACSGLGLLICIAYASIFIGALSSASSGSTATASAPTRGVDTVVPADDTLSSGAGPGSAAPVAKLGESARDGKFEFVVSGMECGTRRIGSDYFNEEAQGQFCIVSLSVRNIGDVPQTFFGSNQYLFNAAGQRFEADTAAGIYLDNSESFIEDINPGNKLSGKVVFDVPPDAFPVSIELHDSAFSSGAAVALN